MYPSCKVENELNEHRNESSLKVSTNYDCSYVDCKYTTLATIHYCGTAYDNCFHHLCQNEYDSCKYSNRFDTLHGVKKY